MKQFMKQMGEWLLVRVIGGLSIILILGIMYLAFNFGYSLNIF